MPQNQKNYLPEDHSEELSEIIGKAPSKILIYTMYTFLLLFLVGIISSFFIRYPEKIAGTITIYNKSFPLKISYPQSLQISRIYVSDGSTVKKGEAIALIDNPSNVQSIQYLRKLTYNFDYIFNNINSIISNDTTQLSFGEIQPEYNSLIANLIKYRQVFDKKNDLKLRSLINTKAKNDSLFKLSREQHSRGIKELAIENERFGDYKKLYSLGVISKHEYFNSLENQANNNSQIQNLEKDKIQQAVGAVKINQEISDFTNFLKTEKENLYHQIFANIRNIDVYIKNWDKKYLILAPRDGRINYQTNVNEGQYYKAGEELFAILSPSSGNTGIAYIQANGFGKIEIGQKTRIKLDKYPYLDYGYLNGVVEKINSVPFNNTYKVTIDILNVDRESLKEKLKNEEEITGEVDIITKDRSLIKKVFNNILNLFDKIDENKPQTSPI